MGPDHWRDEPGEEDPFEGLTLDDDFVRAAPIREPAAAERARAARQANLSRLLADDAARSANQSYELRRYAPDDGDVTEVGDWPAPGHRDRKRPRRIVALVLLVALVLGYAASDYFRPERTPVANGPSGVAASDPTPSQRADGDVSDGDVEAPTTQEMQAARPADWPPLPEEVSEEPLGRPGPVPSGGGAHSFVLMQEDGVTPVGYDPCRPIAYVSRPGQLDAGAQIVADAVAMVSEATGLQFVDEGTTEEAPSEAREPYQADRYGERWAPVLIAWSDPEESSQLSQTIPESPTADVAGYAGSQSAGFTVEDPATGRTSDTGQVFVSGQVVLDEPDLARMLESPDGYARVRAVVAHELAHLVGLGHVEDPSQLMHPAARQTVTGFGPGDLQGLARLGGLSCFPEV